MREMARSRSSSKVHKVLLSPKLEGKAGREHLAGILGFLDAGHVWDVQILRSASELTPAAIRTALADGTEGFLLSVAAARRQKPILDMLARSGRPVVILDDHGPGRSSPSFAYVRFNTAAIVKAALGHFAENMPGAGVAFVPDPSREEWSKAREAAFLSLTGKMRLGRSVFGGQTREQLADWLAALPSPTGVLAANDLTALIVVETCAERGIEVPGRLAILGIDNDELICGHARPPIATVEPNFSGAGFLAATTLQRMMDGRKTPHSIVVTDSVNRIVVRDSARLQASSSHLLRRAMELIEKDCVRLDVPSLARALGVSRSLLTSTFKRASRSVGREIKNARYEKVFELLRNPNQAIGPIANFCGWRSETTLMLDFKKRTGMSMREWRQRHLKGT